MMLKALPLVHFWSVLLLKAQMMTSVRKTSKMLVWSAQNRSISSKICPKNNQKMGWFLPIAFLQSLPRKFPRNSLEINWFFCKFVPKNPAKFDFFFMTYQKPCLNDNLGFSNSLYNSRTFTNGHLSTTATSLQRPVFLADSPYMYWLLFQPLYDGYFVLSPRWPLERGSTVFFMVWYSVWRSVLNEKTIRGTNCRCLLRVSWLQCSEGLEMHSLGFVCFTLSVPVMLILGSCWLKIDSKPSTTFCLHVSLGKGEELKFPTFQKDDEFLGVAVQLPCFPYFQR